ncbi:MAG: HAD family phosphatase [Chloroflexi bacterium]|nr:HAD family phosphatase [Chloroflexota bacterium]MCY3582179.1 HAD family phosphatase [Chloroflexota bacterium]MCY3715172.1 HAD family phosphatase [Chloroflexota bacterium]MDE2649943.1 HAD family phosphatase [Chloroflexota bacterium]MXX82390.1 HAD family phosphatase [Chloroflexota bacterium]
MAIEAVIYDMDGVLVDSEVYWDQARVDFAAERGLRWTETMQRQAMGRSTIGWAKVMREQLALGMSLEAIIAEMKARVIAQYEQRMPTRPGALESVAALQAHYRIGLASGSPTEIIKAVLRITGLDQQFEVIIYGDEVPRGKPAPDIYLEALRQLNIAPERALGIEDSANGLRSLQAAGMFAVAAPSPGFPLPPDVLALADAHIPTLEDFTVDLVREISTSEQVVKH